MATRKRYLFRCSGNLKYLENQLTQVNAVLSFDGHKIHVDFCRLCLVFELQGPIFFCNFFWGVCICMRILSYLFYIQICIGFFVYIYTIHTALSYICRYVLDLRVFLVAEAMFALKMPYFKTADNLNSSSYNADLRNIVNLLSLFICKDERVEI